MRLKQDRLAQLDGRAGLPLPSSWTWPTAPALAQLFAAERFDVVVNLAAQAGVRYSLENPGAYVNSNLVGFVNVLEGCRHTGVRAPGLRLVEFGLRRQHQDAVLRARQRRPSAEPVRRHQEGQRADGPHLQPSVRAADHRAALLHRLRPWGRPDMALFLFTKAILAGRPIDVFNHGRMRRDFTYIDDIVEGVVRVIDRLPRPNPHWSGDAPDPGTSRAPYRVYNIGNNQPVELLDLIETLEDCLGRKADKNLLPMQPGDVPATYADVDDLVRDVGFQPSTPIEEGIARFVEWYRGYHRT